MTQDNTTDSLRVEELVWECLDDTYWSATHDFAEYILKYEERDGRFEDYYIWELTCHPIWTLIRDFEFYTLEERAPLS